MSDEGILAETASEEMASEKSELARQLEGDAKLIDDGDDTATEVHVTLTNGDVLQIPVAGLTDEEAIERVRELTAEAEDEIEKRKAALVGRVQKKLTAHICDSDYLELHSDSWQRFSDGEQVVRAIKVHGPMTIEGNRGTRVFETNESGWVICGPGFDPLPMTNDQFASNWSKVSLRDAPNVGQGSTEVAQDAQAPAEVDRAPQAAPSAYATALTQARDALLRCKEHRLTAATRKEVETALAACEELL
jgi:hypothetical protein